MAKKINCRGTGCTFESKIKPEGLVEGKIIWDLNCPACGNEGLSYESQDAEYVFKCHSCGGTWRKVTCPKCDTLLSGFHTLGCGAESPAYSTVAIAK